MATLADLMEHAASVDPARVAISDSTRSFDYAALDRAAAAVVTLLHETGAVRGDRVALRGVRDARLLALLYAVMRAGMAACVIAPEWSESDISRRLDSITPQCVLTTDRRVTAPAGYPSHHVDVDAIVNSGCGPAPSPPAGTLHEADPAYLSFTSGSSGLPKAVAISHGNAVHYARGICERLGWAGNDGLCTAHVTTLAADLGHTAWLLALATAGRVLVVEDGLSRDPHGLWTALLAEGVTCLKTTPSHMRALLEGHPAAASPLDTLILGGETLSRSFAVRLLADGIAARLVNHYGPTEATIGAACFVASQAKDLPTSETTMPIGSPIGGATLQLEGDRVGELLIGGPGVALGYHQAPTETARRFVLSDGERVYRTGDLCRRRGGDLVFLGRIDRQVKISGYRVDLSEVEHVLGSHPDVAQSAVVVRESAGDRRLAAAVCLEPGTEEKDEPVEGITSYLRERLPTYAVPAPIIILPAFPVKPNRKVDVDRLTEAVDAAVAARAARSAGVSAAANDTTQVLACAIADLWTNALGLPEVSIDADLLAIGGDSILAMRTVALLRARGGGLTVDDVYRHATPALMAAASQSSEPSGPFEANGEHRTLRLAPTQRWFFAQGIKDPDHWNQAVVLRCTVRVRPGALSSAVRAVLERHPALRRPLTPAGPGAALRSVRELSAVSFSHLPRDASAVPATIAELGAELNRSLDLAAGRLVRAHLFSGEGTVEDRIALVVHHAVVDSVSWRILLADLATAYRASLLGRSCTLPSAADFYRWAAAQPPAPPPTEARAPVPAAAPLTLTWSLDRPATARLAGRHGRAQELEALLLTAFVKAIGTADDSHRVRIEVETHGRKAADTGSYLETVGWFTAVKWLDLATEASTADVRWAVQKAQALPLDTPGSRPVIGFNFLGAFWLPPDPLLGWTAADESAGAARCTSGDPLCVLRLTARIINDRLVTDLVYQPVAFPPDRATRAYSMFAAAVTAAAGMTGPPPALIASPASTSGALLHTGATAAPRLHVEREPAHFLLTGATGHLGGHLLDALVSGGARVTCLVRCADADLGPLAHDGAVDVVRGDLSREGLGFAAADASAARRGLTGVVHAAADTRLVAPPRELETTNVEGVRRLLDWIDAGAVVPLHHVSTLAVAGYIDGPAQRFSEADFWIGQRFLSPYERSKFTAEELVRSWSEQGRPAFIYRMGHVAADSRTGTFHRNARTNRIYQTLRGYILAGAAPRLPSITFAFSHADTVAAGLAAIALAPQAAPGVYHLETPYDVTHDEVVRWLRDFGYPVQLVDATAFDRAVARLAAVDPETAEIVGAWARYANRNVQFDRAHTLAALGRLGVYFAEPSPRWRKAALGWAVGSGVMPPVQSTLKDPARVDTERSFHATESASRLNMRSPQLTDRNLAQRRP